MSDSKAIQALVDIWDINCEEGDYVFISTKHSTSGEWKDHSIRYGDGVEKEINKTLNSYPKEKYNLYFCPLPFEKPSRRKSYFKRSKLLWSDLDEVVPDKLKIKPTFIWESSPERFQGLWKLDKFLKKEKVEEINKKLTYYLGADKGGWDITQVLRIPYTINHKYKTKPIVKRFKRTNKTYKVKNLSIKISENDNKKEPTNNLEFGPIIKKYRKAIPRDVMALLLSKRAEVGKRSDIIWYLENKLSEAGLSPEEIITLIKNSVWNKYKGRADEEERFKNEMKKIIERNIQEPSVDHTNVEEDLQPELIIESYKDVMANISSFPGWLIEGFWMRRSHGIIAGEPKSFKSILSMDLAVSVASGKPFLGVFDVKERGPVLIVQNENSEWIVKDRLEKMVLAKGLGGNLKLRGRKLQGKFPPVLPLWFINQQGFRLNDPIHQKILEETVKRIEPILIILDPLYLMFDGDTNSAKDLNPVLNWLLQIRNNYQTGVMVIHHWGKNKANPRGGQKMLGSTTLHGWVESAWYIGVKGTESSQEDNGEEEGPDYFTRSSGDPISLVMEREFRGGGVRPKIEPTLKLGEYGNPFYDIEVKKHVGRGNPSATEELREGILNIVGLSTKTVSQRKLALETGAGRRAIRRVLDELVSEEKIVWNKKGISLKKNKEEKKNE